MIKKLFFTFSLIILLGGCSTKIISSKTTFYSKDYENKGSISVVSKDKADGLEFLNYKVKLEKKLSSIGYSISSDISKAQYIAFISYGVDNGKTETHTVPVYGMTGGGTSYSNGQVGNTYYSGTTTQPISYRVIGTTTETNTYYTRAIDLDIIERITLEYPPIEKTLELKSRSIGSCPRLSSVFDEMLEAIFQDFPGKNGETVTVEIEFKGKQC